MNKDTVREAEIAQGVHYPDYELVLRAMNNLGGNKRKKMRWMHVHNLFALGSTAAHGLCRRFNLDPDEEI